MMYPQIRYATPDDIWDIKRIANQYKDELGFVNRASVLENIRRRTVLVCVRDREIVGFVDYYTRKDQWSTIYHLAVGRSHLKQGIGRQLLYAVPTPLRLSVTQDNHRANNFYAGAGLYLEHVKQGRKRLLNVYEKRVLGIFCMGNGMGDTFPKAARDAGLAYGTRSTEKARDWPYMLDIDWKRFNDNKLSWADYMEMVCQYHPIQAMCVDYEFEHQRRQLYQQIRDLRSAGVLRVMVCPKFPGSVAHVPRWCTLGVSVVSSYAGYFPNENLKDCRVHLLGGSPHKQKAWMVGLQGRGALVVSFDGNSHEKAAGNGMVFLDGKWKRPTRHAGNLDREGYVDLIVDSGRNIQKMLNNVGDLQQLPLL